MTPEITDSPTILQKRTRAFSRRENFLAESLESITPEAVLMNERSEYSRQNILQLQSLQGAIRKQFKQSVFGVMYPAGILDDTGEITAFSGIVSIVIKAKAERLDFIRTQLKRWPYCFLSKRHIEANGQYVWLLTEEVPTTEEHYRAYFMMALRLLGELGLTQDELASANPNPKALCWEGYDEDIWTDFYPIKKVPLATATTSVKDDKTGSNASTSIQQDLHTEWQQTQQRPDEDADKQNASEGVDEPQHIGLLKIRSANGWIAEAKAKPIPENLFDEFWLEGEICILFAEANQGKTILAVQIGDSISRGKPIKGFSMKAKPQVVLYFDFELSAKQFEARYSEGFANHHRWHDNFMRIEIDPDADIPNGISFEDYLNESMEAAIQKTQAKILVVDNITYLRNDTESAKDAGPLMKYLKALKQKYGLSLLILAHCPKRDASRPLTRNDLQGSARLNQFADSMIALGSSAKDSQLKYLKQVKVRSTAYKYDSDNVVVCQIIKKASFLMLDHLRFSTEQEHLKQPSEKDLAHLPEKVQALKEQGKTQTQIAEELEISQPKVSRILAKLAANK